MFGGIKKRGALLLSKTPYKVEMAGFEPASEHIAASTSTFIDQLLKLHRTKRR